MAIIDDFKARFPEFAPATVDDRLPLLVDEYQCFYGFDYNDCHKTAILYLLAHMLVGDLQSGSAPVQLTTSTSVGDVSESFTAPESGGSMAAWLNGTKYGQRFLLLSGHNKGAFFV